MTFIVEFASPIVSVHFFLPTFIERISAAGKGLSATLYLLPIMSFGLMESNFIMYESDEKLPM